MARVRLFGQTFTATPKEQLANGEWLMEAREHATRCSPGTMIRVTKAEIVSMDADEAPAAPDAGRAALEQAMADERKTLPSVQQVLAATKKGDTMPGASPGKAAPAAAPAPKPQDDTMTASKLSALADMAKSTTQELEAQADAALTRLDAAKTKAMGGISKLNDIAADLEKSTSAIEDFANQITNGGPPLDK